MKRAEMPISRRVLMIAVLSVLVILVSMAAYTGPANRSLTVTTYERKACTYQAVYDPPGSGYYGCTYTHYVQPNSSCILASATVGFFTDSVCNWPISCSQAGSQCTVSGPTGEIIENCTPGSLGCVERITVIDRPNAAASATVNCAQPGSNGWCRGTLTVALQGSEPLTGYTITSLEGNYNGSNAADFTLPGSMGSVTPGEGMGTIWYWAVSSFGDTSPKGDVSYKLDYTPPIVALSSSGGILGANGWYQVSPAHLFTGGDAVSGLAGIEYRINGGGWVSGANWTPGADGVYLLEGRAVDNAGNVSPIAAQSVQVDGTAPDVTITSPEPGASVSGSVSVSGICTDALSGVSRVEVSRDGGATWQDAVLSGESWTYLWDTTAGSNGAVTLMARCTDAAGNQAISGAVMVSLNNTTATPTAPATAQPTATPTPQPTATPTAPATAQRTPTPIPQPTATPTAPATAQRTPTPTPPVCPLVTPGADNNPGIVTPTPPVCPLVTPGAGNNPGIVTPTPPVCPFVTPGAGSNPVAAFSPVSNSSGQFSAQSGSLARADYPAPVSCAQNETALYVRVFVDYNLDGYMSPMEGVSNMQVYFLDRTYARLGMAYTLEGQAVFCLTPTLYNTRLYVDIPYLQKFAPVDIPEKPERWVDVWFKGEPPTLPLYLP